MYALIRFHLWGWFGPERGYISDDGGSFYVADDGTTYYVQDS